MDELTSEEWGDVMVLQCEGILPHPQLQMDFFAASALGLLDTVRDILLRGQNINEKNNESWTALMYSCYHGQEKIAKYLSENGASRDLLNNDGRSAMVLAAIVGNLKILQLVFTIGLIDVRDKYDCSALFYAVEHGNFDCAEYLLKQRSNPDELFDNRTLLMLCATRGELKMVKLLLKYSANINMTNKSGKTALHFAEINNHSQIANLLRIHGENNIHFILKKAGLEAYWKYFDNKKITYSQFLSMTEDDMKDIGISLFGPRRKLSIVISDLNSIL